MKIAHRSTTWVLLAIAAAALSAPPAMQLHAGSDRFTVAHGASLLIVFATYLLALALGTLAFSGIPTNSPGWLRAGLRLSLAAAVTVAAMFALLLPYGAIVFTCSLVAYCSSSHSITQLLTAISVATFASSFWGAAIVVPVFFFALSAREANHRSQRLAKNAL